MLENLKVKHQYSRRQGKSVARMVLYECPVCGLDKHTELSRLMRGKGILHRRCAQGLRPVTLLVRESLTELKCVKRGPVSIAGRGLRYLRCHRSPSSGIQPPRRSLPQDGLR